MEMEALEAAMMSLGVESEPLLPAEVHVEVALRRDCWLPAVEVEAMARAWAGSQTVLEAGAVLRGAALGALQEAAAALVVCDAGHVPGDTLTPHDARLTVHVHVLHDADVCRDVLGAGGGGDQDGGGGGACEVWKLPHADLLGAWEGLVLDGSLKTDCLRLVTASLLTHSRSTAREGRSLLLHGPPGCGKTSLCRALAYKLSVRLAQQYPRARLIEVDAHSLFSRWFSESGKLVSKLFHQILELTDDPQMLTIVLVDEVESLAAARSSAAAGMEPSDAVRAVNALLTGLDRLRRRHNALLLATSNVTRAVDTAFVDRADLRRLVAPPTAHAAYVLLRNAIAPLLAQGTVHARELLWPLQALTSAAGQASRQALVSRALLALCTVTAARGVSARALARLPFLALALHCRAHPTLPHLLLAMKRALLQHLQDDADLRNANGATTAL